MVICTRLIFVFISRFKRADSRAKRVYKFRAAQKTFEIPRRVLLLHPEEEEI